MFITSPSSTPLHFGRNGRWEINFKAFVFFSCLTHMFFPFYHLESLFFFFSLLSSSSFFLTVLDSLFLYTHLLDLFFKKIIFHIFSKTSKEVEEVNFFSPFYLTTLHFSAAHNSPSLIYQFFFCSLNSSFKVALQWNLDRFFL